MSDGDGQKALAPDAVLSATVQEFPEVGAGAPIVLRIAAVGERIAPWWSFQRDKELRDFWRTESILASAVYTVISRQAAFSWTLEGSPRAVKRAHDMLTHADMGAGWEYFISKISEDLATQDNGAFIEVIRPKGQGPEAAPIGIAHLDAGACTRTGDPEIPIIYMDRKGKPHALKWWQVICLAEMPSPIQTMNGVGFCAISRVLKAAMILKDISTYKAEKVSARPQRGIWFVKGMRPSVIEDGIKEAQEAQESEGLTRFVKPIIIASMDAGAPLEVEQFDFASLPDGFDEEITLRWYIAQLAMGFATDYQEFAPMPGQKLGTAMQSEVQAQKARGKGRAMFMKMVAFALNQWVLSKSVDFGFVEVDPAEEEEKARIAKLRAEERKIRIDSMEITPQEARQLALDAGDLPAEMVEKDVTKETVARDIEGPPREGERPEGGEEASAKEFFRGNQKAHPEHGRLGASAGRDNSAFRRRPGGPPGQVGKAGDATSLEGIPE